MSSIWIVVFWLVVVKNSTTALSSFHIVIPSAVVRGRNAVLACLYDLEGQPLYTLKWYKGNREFYRYTPRDSPPIKVFPIDGLTVNVDVSNDTHVLLENVSDDNRGKYSCELSADAPSFITKIETGTLSVVDLPAEDPTIEGLKQKYRIGEVLKANCTSGESAPATNLTWFVNGRRTEEQKAYHQHRITRKGRHMESSYSILKIPITKELFRKGRLKIRCVASMHDVYYRSLEKSVDLEKKRHHHNHNYHQHKHLHRIQQDGKAETLFATTVYPHVEDIEWEYEALPAERQPEVVRAFEVSNRNGSGRCNEFPAWNLLLTVFVLFLIHER